MNKPNDNVDEIAPKGQILDTNSTNEPSAKPDEDATKTMADAGGTSGITD